MEGRYTDTSVENARNLIEQFERRMDDLIDRIRVSEKALDQERIYVPGEKEYARSDIHARRGIPLARNVFDTLLRIGEACGAERVRTVPAQPAEEPTAGVGSR
jgi:LDH2 family malate/lactate/ureidoglycolate dehydrogenase